MQVNGLLFHEIYWRGRYCTLQRMTISNSETPVLLIIPELGGYPDFTRLYRHLGFQVNQMQSMRKALKFIKKHHVDVIVAEFNFQSDFRDRTSQLESLMASLAQSPEVKVIVFYDREQSHQLKKLTDRFALQATLAYPVREEVLES